MNSMKRSVLAATFALMVGLGLSAWAQPGGAGERADEPRPGGPGSGGFAFGPGGMNRDVELVKQFDKDGNGWLNTQERQEARKSRQQGGRPGPGRFGGPPGGFPGSRRQSTTPQPGINITPAEVTSYPDAPLYAPNVLRTLFLDFESPDWETELEAFYHTDVDVPARLTVDGKTYPDIGVRFRGNTSYMMAGPDGKRPLNLSMDMAHKGQNLLGFRTLNLLNSAEDPSFLRTVLSLQIARDYMPAPRANFVRVVVNGENWGVFANVEQFNKDFLEANFGTRKGARWKVPVAFGGNGGLAYLGDDVADYLRSYELKSGEDPKAWDRLISLCKTLNETPPEDVEARLGPLLDIDGALRFLAWDNVLAGGDGYWTRASDYSMYQDPQGKFHIIPYDVNETFGGGGFPGGRGGPGRGRGRDRGGPGGGGPGGRDGGPGGPGGPGAGFGPGMILAPQFLRLAEKDGDSKLSATEFNKLPDACYDLMDPDHTEKVNQDQCIEGVNKLFPQPPGGGQFGPPGNIPVRFGPGMFVAPALFTAANSNKDDHLTRAELKDLFAKWAKDWNLAQAGALDEEAIRNGLNSSLPPPDFGNVLIGPGGRRGPGRPGGPGGPFLLGGPGRGGPTLDPFVAAQDPTKPLIVKLLAVPALRERYLGYIRHMAETWLDWNKLGKVAEEFHALIADEVKIDTKKPFTFEEFQTALAGDSPEGRLSLKSFADQRRAFLLDHAEVKKAKPIPPRP